MRICATCEQPIRPDLILTRSENIELYRLSKEDWRAWAKRVLELSDPELQEKRKLLNRMIRDAEGRSRL